MNDTRQPRRDLSGAQRPERRRSGKGVRYWLLAGLCVIIALAVGFALGRVLVERWVLTQGAAPSRASPASTSARERGKLPEVIIEPSEPSEERKDSEKRKRKSRVRAGTAVAGVSLGASSPSVPRQAVS